MSDENGSGANSVVEQGADIHDVNTPLPDEKPVAEKPKAEPKEAELSDEDDEGEDEGSERKARRQRQRDRLKTENDELRRKLQGFEQPQAETQKPKPEASDSEPKIGDYADYLEYADARTEWRVRQALKAQGEAQKAEADKAKAEGDYTKKVESYRERTAPVIEAIPDFNDRVQDLIDRGLVSKQLEDAVLDSPMGELITVHLLTNPSDLQIMQGMDEKQLYRAIGLIEASIKSQMSSAQSPPLKKTSAAAPISPVGKKASTSTKGIEDMDQQEFEAHVAKLKSSGR